MEKPQSQRKLTKEFVSAANRKTKLDSRGAKKFMFTVLFLVENEELQISANTMSRQ